MPRGRPKAFKTKEDFLNSFKRYNDVCIATEQLPNIAGFCVFADITRETFYKQNEYYSDTFKKIQLYLEDGALNAPIPPAVKIFYLKNKFKEDYKDKQELEHSGKLDTTINIIPASKKK